MKKTSVQVIVYTLLVYGLAMLASCSNDKGQPLTSEQLQYHWRAQVMENNTITPVYMTMGERLLYEAGDSVWVDLRTHRVNDTSENTMLCRLIRSKLIN